MTNNDVLRRIRFIFDYNDQEMIAIFKHAGADVTKAEVCDWLKKEDDLALEPIADKGLATFLNGLIIEKRGRREGPLPVAESILTNNITLQKLKIAFNLKSEDLLALFASVDVKMSAHELSAFFRKPNHRHHREFMDQYLRNLLMALQLKTSKKQGPS